MKFSVVVVLVVVLCIVCLLEFFFVFMWFIVSLWKIIEIIWKVELLFSLVVRNSVRKIVKNVMKFLFCLLVGKVRNSRLLKIVIRIKFISVIWVLFRWLDNVLFVECVSVLINGLKKVYCRIWIFGNCVFDSIVKFVEKLMKELKVVRYSRFIIYRWFCLSIGNCFLMEVFEVVRLFMLNYVVMVKMVRNGIYI